MKETYKEEDVEEKQKILCGCNATFSHVDDSEIKKKTLPGCKNSILNTLLK